MYNPKTSEHEALWEECTIQAMDLSVACEQHFARCTGGDDRSFGDEIRAQQSWEAEGGRARSILRELSAPQFPRASKETFALLVDCMESVRLMQSFLLRRSDFVPILAAALAEICDTSAEEFERLPAEEGWAELADSCREFSELLDQIEYEESVVGGPSEEEEEDEGGEGESVA
jgi:hypothetical protein